MNYQAHQIKLLKIADSKYRGDNALSKQVKNAFLQTPRHLYIDRFKADDDGNWIEITEHNLSANLSTLYADKPLLLFDSAENNKPKTGIKMMSTISQPSFVLRLLDLLQIQKGHCVFELGTASGWNAALISTLVGDSGKVISFEIISDLAESAKSKIMKHGYNNVHIISGDGGDGYSSNAPYDRVIFTAGAFDLPHAFYTQVKTGGLVLFILKINGNTDYLYILEKQKDHFRSIYSLPCMFVPMTGKYYHANAENKSLSDIIEQHSLPKTKLEERPFWWGASEEGHFFWQTDALCSYLSLFDNFVILKEKNAADSHFGWIENNTIAVAQPNTLTYYGEKNSENSLIRHIEDWVNMGMPTRSNFLLSIYPNNPHSDHRVETNNDTWISTRDQSTFVWQLLPNQ